VRNHEISLARQGDDKYLHRLEEDCFSPVDIFRPAQFRYLLGSPSCRILVIREDGGRVLAELVGLFRHFSIPSGRIYKIAVHPSLRGQGWGGRLIEAMEVEFIKAGMVKAFAEIRESNKKSWAMFEKNGYFVIRKLPGYYVDGEVGVKFRKILGSGCV